MSHTLLPTTFQTLVPGPNLKIDEKTRVMSFAQVANWIYMDIVVLHRSSS
jgi:hypothetical protein